eukprot:1160649-Pelagomonas_calceolata.AAC.16
MDVLSHLLVLQNTAIIEWLAPTIRDFTRLFIALTMPSSEDAIHFVQKQTNDTHRFISDFMDIFCAVGTVEQTEQPNYLA